MVLYWFLKIVLNVWYRQVLRVRLDGLGHVPRGHGFVVCSNHISWQDPMLLGALLPEQLFFMTKAEAFTSPVGGLILRTVGAFPVRRHTADRGAIRHALNLLKRRRSVVVFPEGTRSRDGQLGVAEPGAALLALWSGASVLPIAISGRYRRGQLRVSIGAPFRLKPAGQRPSTAELQQIAQEQIMGAVGALVRRGTDTAAVATGPA
jgi:1-acyl-sn-glycerol-3-phosphate acyltransferase